MFSNEDLSALNEDVSVLNKLSPSVQNVAFECHDVFSNEDVGVLN